MGNEEITMTKKPKFDGSTNLEAALNIKSVDSTELIDADDSFNPLAIIPKSKPDEPDTDIADDIEELYDRAISAFDDNMDQIEAMEPKYVSRAMEVNRQYLDTALAAIALKQRTKEHASKMNIELQKLKNNTKGGATVIEGDEIVIIGDRNAILAELLKNQFPDPIDMLSKDGDK